MQYEQPFENILDKFKRYIDTCYDLTVLKISEKVSVNISRIVSRFLIIPVIILSVVFLSFAAALYISSVLNNDYEGFLIVGGAYLALSIIMICFRKMLLEKPLQNKIIKEICKEDQF
ncbi:MAG: hypothetical protein HYU69_02025 [Bacteroidetes bacterium]|nr:hypothetical protein [Bacteroidota bacterium]